MANKYINTDLLDRAIIFAVKAHHNTERRGKGFPYIVHPMEAVEIYCANRGLDTEAFVLKKDSYAYHMMNLLDYLVGNTDRHWGNWGFFVDNRTNKLKKLYPLMDFNKSFLAYDTLDGVRCQTTGRKLSQREAALEAVQSVGLNQCEEVLPAWFHNPAIREMFFRRLEVVKSAAGGGMG